MKSQTSTALFESWPVWKALKAMALPAIFSQIIILIYNMADTFYIGCCSNHHMTAGLSLILPVFNLNLCISALAGIGGGTLISRLLGQRRQREAGKVGAFAFWLAILLVACASGALFLFMEPMLRLLGAESGSEVFAYARIYAFCVIVLGAVPTAASNVLAQFFRSIGCSFQASFGITMGGLLNIVLDPLFMFVLLKGHNPLWGVGIATLLSNCTALLYFLLLIARGTGEHLLKLSCFQGRPEIKSILSIFKVGIPAAVSTLLFDVDYMVLDALMAGYGPSALAAIGVVLKVERLPLNIGIGICQGMVPLVAYNYASSSHKRMMDCIQLALKTGLIAGAVSILLYQLAPGWLVELFVHEAQSVFLAQNFLRVRILATPLMFASFFTVHLFQALGKGGTALFLGTARWAVLNIPMLFLLNALFGMMGLVYAQISADVLNVILSFLVWKHFYSTHLITRPILES